MNVDQIFCITELADQRNSHFLNDQKGTSASNKKKLQQIRQEQTFWKLALQANPIVEEESYDIFTLPRYMSGRLFHDQLCENLLVQSFFNPNIHRIIRQFVGGPRSTGCLLLYKLPAHLRQAAEEEYVSYGRVFTYFTDHSYSGICIGLYRQPHHCADSRYRFPIVLTGPQSGFKIQSDDAVYVLIGWHTIEKSARQIQRVFRGYSSRHDNRM